MANYIATCRTAGCVNEGVPIDVGDLRVEDPATGDTIVATVACGGCGQPITDVVTNP